MEIIDISRDLMTAQVYEGDPVPKMERISRLDTGDECNLSALYACLHAGTHADAPRHFIENGEDIASLPLAPFIGPCRVIEIPGVVTGADIDRLFPKDCTRVLIKTGGEGYLHKSAADEIAIRAPLLLGIDSLSIGSPEEPRSAHRALLGAGVGVLEGLELSCVSPGDYFLFAPPVKIGSADGAPARAVLISGYIFWGGKS